MTSRSIVLALAALAATACAPDFTSPTEVHGLRVLGVRAEPPELSPPGEGDAPARAALGALVAHPAFVTDPARRATVLHLACTPVPGAAGGNPCTVLTTLADPLALLPLVDAEQACAAPGLGAPGAITLAGLEACGPAGCEPVVVRRDPAEPASAVELPSPAYEVPAEASLASLPAGDPARVLGAELVVLSLALDVGPEALAPTSAVATPCDALATAVQRFAAAWPTAANEIAVKRILLRGPDALSAPNQNPALTAIAYEGAPLPPPGAAPASIPAGAERDLFPVLPGDPAALAERWIEADEEGKPVRERTEEWTYAWFTTAGELDDPYTRAAADPARLTAPGAGPLVVWLVVRDLRGGLSWSAGALQAVTP